MESKQPYTISIENVVVSADLKRRIDLNKLARECPSAEYNPSTFPGLVYRPRFDGKNDIPAKAVLIFSAGKLVFTGAKSSKYAEQMVNKFVHHVIEKYFGKQNEKPDIKVSNVVASGSFYGDIILENIGLLQLEYPERYSVINEPEQFPAAIVRDKLKLDGKVEKKPTFLLFSSGKYISAGCSCEESVEYRLNDLYSALFNLKIIEKKEQVLAIH
jgi:transcription initiation factor TFIID TATA-box-binding protein